MLFFGLAFLVRAFLAYGARFNFDEATFFETALLLARGEEFPLLGTPITADAARHPGNLFFLLISVPLLLFESPILANIWVAFLNTLSLVPLILFLKRMVPERKELIQLATLLVCFSPWFLLYADRIWNSNLAIPWVALALYFWSKAEDHPLFLAGCLISLAVVPQFHMSAPIVWAAFLPMLWIKRRNIRIKTVLLAVVGILLCYSSFLIHEFQTDFLNTRNILFGSVSGEGKPFSTKPFLQTPLWLIRFLSLDFIYHERSGYWFGQNERQWLQGFFLVTPSRPGWTGVLVLASYLLPLSTLALLWKKGMNSIRNKFFSWKWLVLALGVSVNIILLLKARKTVHPHYVHLLIPFVVWGAVELFKGIEIKNWHKFYLYFFCFFGLVGTISLNRRVDSRNSISFQRLVVQKIKNAGIEEATIDSDFFLSPESYEKLAAIEFNFPLELKFPLKSENQGNVVKLRKKRFENADLVKNIWVNIE